MKTECHKVCKKVSAFLKGSPLHGRKEKENPVSYLYTIKFQLLYTYLDYQISIFSYNRRVYNLRSGSLLKLPTVKTTTYGTSSLAFRDSILWNSLPNTIKDPSCVNKFKILIKEWKGENANLKIVGRTTSAETPSMLIFNLAQVVGLLCKFFLCRELV